ncbi:sodium:proton antiporter [Lactobacillus sp. DCY120]|uniref:Sodium:proton antiporter n=1 Tax=Bombilactobacillus apium TaxID=2675299 RepID=A0A850R2S1_9LACO|nr:sodium:proton antiporter [Bombilactobacillus apium]NVY96650.1 sodium:proton antiporter [Bombilactobacillus apium]
MEIFLNTLLLVTATVVANIVHSLYPSIPLAFDQIAAGFALSWFPQFDHFQLDPELFFLMILAPLMFNEGQQTNYTSLRKNFRSTLSLAVVLAVVTIVASGLMAHWFWPVLPVALLFCLAAIVTPTDAVAVSSITSNIEMPELLMETLENESLFNDASGLVALSVALTAFRTGHFSLSLGLESFFVSFVGGVCLGVILGFLFVLIQIFFQRRLFNAAAIILPFNLIAPFLAYWLAEEFHLSGILAVVALGIVHGIYQKRLRLTSTSNQVVLTTSWEILSSLLNGFVFVLLGVTLPRNMIELSQSSQLHLSVLLELSIGLYVLMFVFRFLWTWFGLVKIPFRHQRERGKNGLIVALSGMHGTINLAMAFSLPLVVKKNLLPFRTDMIFISEVVIVLSLVIPTIFLPRILKPKQRSFTMREFNRNLVKMVDYATQELQTNDYDDYLAASRVITLLNSQRGHHEQASFKQVAQMLERTQNLEVAIINDYARNGQISYENARRYNWKQWSYLKHASVNPIIRLRVGWKMMRMTFSHKKPAPKNPGWIPRYLPTAIDQVDVDQHQIFRRMESWGYRAIMTYLRRMQRPENKAATRVVRHYYEIRHQRMNQKHTSSAVEEELLMKSFQYEYSYIQQAAKTGKITPELATALNEKVSTDQFVYLTSDD